MLSRDTIVSVTASVIAFPKSTVVEASPDAPEDVLDWRRGKVANPMTKYAEFRDSRPSATGRDSGRTAGTRPAGPDGPRHDRLASAYRRGRARA